MDMGADADTLVEGIDAGDIDPESVEIRPFVEDDDKVLTPELAERLPDDKVERYNELVAKRDATELREESRLSDGEQSALDQLRPDTKDETVPLADTDVRVPVQTHTNRQVEQAIQRVIDEGERDSPELSAVRDEMISVIVELIKDDEYSNRRLWEEYADEYGITYVYDNFEAVAGPVLERMEAMANQQSFRSDG